MTPNVAPEADDARSLLAATKPELVVMRTEDINAETPAHLLDDETTPVNRLFVRSTGTVPAFSDDELAGWELRIDGEVERPGEWPLDVLKQKFAPVTLTAVIECAGNGRAFFPAPTSSPPWTYGAVGCVAWTGVRLAELLGHCGLTSRAVYTAHFSPDRDLQGTGPAISRGVPIAKALAPETLVAFALNGEPIPRLHGGPLRLVVPGFPGSASQKWLTGIVIRDREHDGARMTGTNYRLPKTPVRPGEPIDPANFQVITDMPVKSLITYPAVDFTAPADRPLGVRGYAWSGHTPVGKVEVSFDRGNSWGEARLRPPTDRFAWRRFESTLPMASRGPIEIVARATDTAGRTQPLTSAPWNPRGYCNNTVHRVRGTVR